MIPEHARDLIRRQRRRWLAAFVLVSCACSRGKDGADPWPDQALPPFAVTYSSGAGLEGIAGGQAADSFGHLLTARLEARGDDADPDAALAGTAAWLLKSKYAGQRFVDADAIRRAAWRFGYAGAIVGSIVVASKSSQAAARVAELVDQVPLNHHVTRYGIAARGGDVALVLGELEIEFDDFPRALAPGSDVRLWGAAGQRFELASLYATNPSGTQAFPMAGRDFDQLLVLDEPGVHWIEVMGEGPDGPSVLMNVPIWVGVPEEEVPARVVEPDPNLSDDDAEEALFFALNDARRKAALAPLEFDVELRSVARAHSTDMAAHDFVGHTSPNTGSFDDRAKDAGLRGSKFGECVALEVTPEGAHAGLFQSPAHRLAMLDADFTHVGVGVAFDVKPSLPRRLLATLVLARHAPPEAARQTPAQLFEAVQGDRRARKLGSLRHDPTLKAAAAAGIRALKRKPGLDSEKILEAAGAELQRQVDRSGGMRSVCHLYLDVIEPYELLQQPILQRPELTAIGIDTHVMEDAKGPRLGVMLVAEPDLVCGE